MRLEDQMPSNRSNFYVIPSYVLTRQRAKRKSLRQWLIEWAEWLFSPERFGG